MLEPTFVNVVRCGALGDVLYAEPVVRALANKGYKNISFYCDEPYRPLFENHPFLKEIHISKCSNNGNPTLPYRNHLMYCLNWIYEDAWFRGDNRYISDLYLNHFSLPKPSPAFPQLFLSKNELRPMFPKYKNVMVINAISRHTLDGWPEIIEHAKQHGFYTVGVGQDRHTQLNLQFDQDLRNKTNLRELISVINQADVVVSLESGPLPIADCLEKPGIALIAESEPHTILRPNTKLIPIACHNLTLDFVELRKTKLKPKNLKLKIEQIKQTISQL